MRLPAKKAILAVLLAVFVFALSLPVAAAPTADPDYVEITLREFREQHPHYKGIDDPRDVPSTRIADPGYVTSSYNGPFVWRQTGSKWYLYADNGATKVTTGGWYQDGGYWYFLYPVGEEKYTGAIADGEMAVGWEKIGGHWYYFSGSGVMQKDWYQISNTWYYLRTGPETIKGKSYPTGSMVMGEHFLNSQKGSSTRDKNFYFDAYGAMQLWYYPLYAASDADRYHVNSPFAQSEGRDDIHNGLDLAAPIGTRIDSPCVGTVIFADFASKMGNVVMIRSNTTAPNEQKIITRIMHMSEIPSIITVDASVVTGTYIGKSGNSGGVPQHFHIDMNAFGITTGTVTYLNGQNPAAFFTDIPWNTEWWPAYGSDKIGYQD